MLLDTRRWVLEQAGFAVFTISSMDSAVQVVAEHSVDLLLLCHTLTPAERHSVVATASAFKPQIKKLVMTTAAEEACREELEGESLHVFAGAEGLVAATRKALTGRSHKI